MNKQMEAMCRLGMTKEEITEVLEADKMIDQGIKLFELTPEQEKASKQARQADRKPKVYDLDNTGGKRSKKANEDKQYLIKAIQAGLKMYCGGLNEASIETQNPEREFTFTYNDTKYKVVLSIPRT